MHLEEPVISITTYMSFMWRGRQFWKYLQTMLRNVIICLWNFLKDLISTVKAPFTVVIN